MSKETIFEQLKRELSFIYDKEITLQTNFVEDLKMDNLDMEALISDIEDGFSINADSFSEKPLTVEDLVDEIWGQVGGAKMSMEDIDMQLYNGDCLEVMKNIADNSVDLIVTDPPYKVTARGNAGNSGGMFQKKLSMQGKIFKHNSISSMQYIPEFFRILKDGSHCYIMTNHVNLQEILNTATQCGFHFIKSLIWDKGNKIMGQFYMSQFEYILFFRKGKGIKINNCGTSDILTIPNKKTKDRQGANIHDTEKPVALIKILIENSSQEKDVVMDPFMGVGSAALACDELNRNFIGIELDETYFNIAKQRIEQAHETKELF